MALWHGVDHGSTRDRSFTYALVIGVSRYAYLPQRAEDPDPVDRRTFGLRPLECGATSALAVAQWLRGEYNNPDAPLRSIRLLISPSQREQEMVDGMASAVATTAPAMRDDVEAALAGWRADCTDDRDGVAILYIAGHGIMISPEEAVLVLLEDFAEYPGMEFNASVDLQAVRLGMRGDNLPDRQFYFADACAFAPQLKPGEQLRGGVQFNAGPLPAPMVSPLYASAAPGTRAWGQPAKCTFFSQALIESLRLLAVESDDSGEWVVHDTQLIGALRRRVGELASDHLVAQSVNPGGRFGDVPFHRLAAPPDVPVEIFVDPDEASPVSFATLTDGYHELFTHRPLQPPIHDDVPAGNYTVAVTIDPDTPPYCARDRIPCPAMPPKPRPLRVKVTQ